MVDFAASLSGFAGSAIDNWAIQRAARQWGIFLPYKDKKPQNVLSAANVDSIDLTRQTSISTAPQEEGAFLSYDKVQAPYQGTIRFICDGSETGSIAENLLPGWIKGFVGDGPNEVKRTFVNALEALVADTNLYFIATPQRIYKRANIVGYRFTRSTDTTDYIAVDVTIQEVRSAMTSGWINSKYPQGAQKENGGYVQLVQPEVGGLY